MTSGIRIMARVLPIAYPVLGERFDALHPLMFGTASTCSRIAKAIGTGAELHPAQRSTDVATVRLCGDYAARDVHLGRCLYGAIH
jgi:hypothetical protein